MIIFKILKYLTYKAFYKRPRSNAGAIGNCFSKVKQTKRKADNLVKMINSLF